MSIPVVALLAVWTALAPAPSPERVRRDEVEYANGGVHLAATLLLPEAAGPVPGVVIVHGSGTSDRSNPWTAAYAKDLVARGIAVLYPDKRGSGKSGGDWKTASFEELAADAAAGVARLAEEPEIDRARLGVIGFSQGGAVAAIVAATCPDCRFVITISGSTVPLLDQVVDEIAIGAERAGHPLTPGELLLVKELHREAFRFASTGQGFDELQSHLTQSRAQSPALREALTGFPPNRDHWIWGFMKSVGAFDPLPYWQKSKLPAVLVFGGQDTQVRSRDSEKRLLDTLGDEPRQLSILHFQKNAHALHRDDLLDFLARFIAAPNG
jgi:pimeloyl-ACP methyl ester carboxylesterase